MTNPLFRKPTGPLAASDNPYLIFGWTENPFPDKPGVIPDSEDARVNGMTYRPDIRAREESEFDRLLLNKQPPRPVVFLMDFATRRGRGIGKTAFLSHQCRRIMNDLGDAATGGERVLVAAHMSPPAEGRCRRFWQVSQLLVRSLVEQHVVARAMWRIRAFSGIIPDAVLELVGDDPTTTIGDNRWLEKHGVGEFDISESVKKLLASQGVSDEVAHHLAWSGHVTDGARSALFEKWTETDWRKNAGTLVFDELVRAFRAARINQGLLLLDDVERIVTHQSIRERAAFAEDIRHTFIDGANANARTRFYSLLLTIHPYIQELLVTHWNRAGLDRFCSLSGKMDTEYTIYFQPLDASAAEPLVIEYSNRVRVDSAERNSLRPFDLPGLKEALKLADGLPGVMLALLHNVVEEAAKVRWQSISAEQVRDVFQRQSPEEVFETPLTTPLPSTRVDLSKE